jgi:hypothetical protein
LAMPRGDQAGRRKPARGADFRCGVWWGGARCCDDWCISRCIERGRRCIGRALRLGESRREGRYNLSARSRGASDERVLPQRQALLTGTNIPAGATSLSKRQSFGFVREAFPLKGTKPPASARRVCQPGSPWDRRPDSPLCWAAYRAAPGSPPMLQVLSPWSWRRSSPSGALLWALSGARERSVVLRIQMASGLVERHLYLGRSYVPVLPEREGGRVGTAKIA